MAIDMKGRVVSHDKPAHKFTWLLAGLGIGLFVAFMVYVSRQPPTEIPFSIAVKQELEKHKPTNKPATQQDKHKAEEPRFNFYTILPELEVLIPDSEIPPPPTGTETPSKYEQKLVSGKKYILQAGSFRNPHDAERLKASLALLGVQANVHYVHVNNESWHRVRIGPFDNTGDLSSTRTRLKTHNIDAMALELRE